MFRHFRRAAGALGRRWMLGSRVSLCVAIIATVGTLALIPAIEGPGATAAGGPPAWDPATTWVFAVGVLEWKDSNDWAGFTKVARRDAQLVETLKSRGVPASHVVYLSDRQTTKANIQQSLRALLSRTSAGDTLILYYCGHGDKDEDGKGYFAPYDAGDWSQCWSVASIVDTVEREFNGDRAFLAADCCTSGTLAQAARNRGKRVSYAVMTSSSANQSSTSNWTFTQALIDGFSGNPGVDLNQDGKVVLHELAEYARDEMADFEGQRASVAFAGTSTDGTPGFAEGQFRPLTKIADDDRRLTPPGRRIEAYFDGAWWKARELEKKDGKALVRWIQIGYDTDKSDEWISLQNIRPIKVLELEPGTAVKVEWKGKWYPAQVLKSDHGIHYVHYDDYADVWDEWVPPDRIRRAAG